MMRGYTHLHRVLQNSRAETKNGRYGQPQYLIPIFSQFLASLEGVIKIAPGQTSSKREILVLNADCVTGGWGQGGGVGRTQGVNTKEQSVPLSPQFIFRMAILLLPWLKINLLQQRLVDKPFKAFKPISAKIVSVHLCVCAFEKRSEDYIAVPIG